MKTAFLVLAGIAAAVCLGLAANEISGNSIGLSAKPLRSGEQLAPPQRGDRAARSESKRKRPAAAPAATPPASSPADDHGGERSGRDRSGDSGSGERGSGERSGGDSGSGCSGGGDNSGRGSSDD
jgi:hypothetical protein